MRSSYTSPVLEEAGSEGELLLCLLHNVNYRLRRSCCVIDSTKCRKLGSVWLLSQGLLTALLPQLSLTLIKRIIGTNFENAAALEAKPAYVRELRALGVGMAAAGIARLVMETRCGGDDDSSDDNR